MCRGLMLVLAGAALAVSGCADDALELAVDLKTDLVAGVEFTAVRTTLVVSGTPGTTVERGAFVGESYVAGRRVADLRGLALGEQAVRVQLLSATGAGVAERVVRVTVRGSLSIIVLITRDCRGVTCPRAGDAPTATECFGGRCVDPLCSLEHNELCGTAECARDDQCVPAASCARGTCESGVCVFTPTPDGCSPGRYCSSELGCRALPGDAGAVDAGTFVGDAGSGACSPAMAMSCDDGDPCNGRETCVASGCVLGAVLDCSDGVACTVDSCGVAGCTHAPSDALCAAAAGGRCDPVAGCQYPTCTPATCVAGPCELASCAGDTCVRTRTCAGGQVCCAGACVTAGCDDGNACTDDGCGPGGCRHVPSTSPCDDGDGCTTADRCASATCSGTPIVCAEDSNECTSATCLRGSCLFLPNSEPCTHPNPCVASGQCAGGGCDPATFMPRGSPCTDGNLCTTGDFCATDGNCAHLMETSCMTPMVCDPATGLCPAA